MDSMMWLGGWDGEISSGGLAGPRILQKACYTCREGKVMVGPGMLPTCLACGSLQPPVRVALCDPG